MTDQLELKPSEVRAAIEDCLASGIIPITLGPMGVGKSSIHAQICDDLGLEFLDVRTTQMEAVDARGLPIPDTSAGLTRWLRPEFLPTKGAGVLFLDELPSAPKAIQISLYQLLTDRCIGPHRIGDDWLIAAAGNRMEDAAGVSKMLAPMANRLVHLFIRADIDDWTLWAIDHQMPQALIAFLRWRSELLYDFSPEPGKGIHGFPTPRSWEAVGHIFNREPSKAVEPALYAGAVGAGAAAEWLGFIKIFRQLPNIDAALLNPDKVDLPNNDPSTLYAFVAGLSGRVGENTMDNFCKLLDKFSAEYATLGMKLAIGRDNDLVHTTAYSRWAATNKEAA